MRACTPPTFRPGRRRGCPDSSQGSAGESRPSGVTRWPSRTRGFAERTPGSSTSWRAPRKSSRCKKKFRDSGSGAEPARRAEGRRELMAAVTAAASELGGTKPACEALGVSRASYYRARRPRPPDAWPPSPWKRLGDCCAPRGPASSDRSRARRKRPVNKRRCRDSIMKRVVLYRSPLGFPRS